MESVYLPVKQYTLLAPASQQPIFLSQSPPQPTSVVDTGGFNLNNKVSPSILLVIIILAMIFFVSGLLHLLIRFLLRPPIRDTDDLESVTALQGQLQQLFHLHDAGVDQSFIDTLPVFHYKAIIGPKNPFDCAVCLCEFEPEDKLRLLPKCSHAFHMECIDTWLLSHSTCPLCRGSLLPDFSPNNSCSPVVLVLESGSESSREIVNDREGGRTYSVLTANSYPGFHGDHGLGSSRLDVSEKSSEILTKDEPVQAVVVGDSGEEKVVPVKLGKFKSVVVGEGSSNSADARRCYSMGSFEYVMDESSSLQVPIRTPMKKQSSKKPSLPLTPGQRPAMSECDCESRREFPGFEGIGSLEADNGSATPSILPGNNATAKIGRSKRESFSISKIWLRGKKEKQSPSQDSSRRALSFRFPANENSVAAAAAAADELKVKKGAACARRTKSEMGISRWETGGIEEENQNQNQNQGCNNSLEFQAKTPSFARRTLLWLVGSRQQNKVVHSPFTGNV